MATSLLKDSIQDSLNMIVSDDGKLSDAALRRELDTKFPSVMCKPIPIDAVFKDQAKFDTQNPVISLQLAQIEIGKKQKEKEIKKQLATARSMKDLTIAERLQQLSQCNRNRLLDGSGGNDDDDGNGRPPPPAQQQLLPPPYDFPHSFLILPLSDNDDDDDNDNDAPPPLVPAQKLAQQLMLGGDGSTTGETEKASVKKKVVLSKN